MANHVFFGAITDPSSNGKTVVAVSYNTTNGSWPARPAGGGAIVTLWIGPDTASAPGDFVSGDVRLKYTP